ncbi:Coenzyme F420 hydrogenase/dehydrogenase, beta subunit C-terminal domain [Robinsoniella peoriensis]|uniref:Ferredoxin n=1 Tax=Robinsoniella peoriensis TaxID=180332 RepID=A0A4V6HS25_9FIRM|nr:Coenzyme F420 hydrogenase/dehydrogenase, beta subunit C-terminal domain [Robinsoniella peoriensis]MDU7028129.1 Coenzyme F420 hydrogenase/dehydrogenase, beta subunit C-terminal domain [Clostridiales bacterium]TLD01348.1 Ferredoxin [Robinsoniella peoriensis]
MIEKYHDKCTGCNVCSSVCKKEAIALKIDDKGFWYPVVDANKCVKCGRCESICPVSNKYKLDNHLNMIYVAQNRDNNIRKNSSSGGIFYSIAKNILDMDGFVVGAAFSEDYHTVHHIIINDEKDLYKLQGSKYVQSYIEPQIYNDIKNLLEDRKRVLFSGTPCQINAINKIFSKQYNNFLTIDIVCHGVPSPLTWKEYVIEAEKKYNAKLTKANFRAKPNGWKRYELLLKFSNQTYSKWFNEDAYGKSFIHNIFLRDCCYTCQFKGIPRNADISLGDFWGIDKEYDDDKGTSLLIVNSLQGKELLESISNEINYTDIKIEKAFPGNYALLKSSKYFEKREDAFKRLKDSNYSFSSIVKKYTHVSLIKRVINKVQRIVKR